MRVLRGSFRTSVRRHWLFLVVAAVGFALRVLAVMAYRPALFYLGDSVVYLFNAGHLRPDSFHPAGYAVFLALLSNLGRNLMVVPVAQHILGVAAASLIYAALIRRDVRPWLAALGSAPLLLDGYQVDVEQMVMSEALVTFLLVAGFALLLWKPPAPMFYLMGAGACLAAAAVTRSAVMVAIIPAILLVAGRDRSSLTRAGVLGVSFAALALAYAGWHAAADGNFTIDDKTGLFLYGRVAPIANCSRLPPSDQPLCDTRPIGHRPGEDYYIWSPMSPMRRHLRTHSYIVPEGRVGTFAFDTIRNQPFDYARLVLWDTARYFKPLRTTYYYDAPIQALQFPTSIRWATNIVLTNQGFVRSGGRALAPTRRTFWLPVATNLHDYQLIGYTPGPLLLLAVLLVGLGIVRRRPDRSAMLLVLCGLLQLVAASAAAQFDYRFLIPAQPFLMMGGILSLRKFSWARPLNIRT